jgi:hypothetical protein
MLGGEMTIPTKTYPLDAFFRLDEQLEALEAQMRRPKTGDLVERLRESNDCYGDDAADEITRLRAERDALYAAVENFINVRGRHHTEQACDNLLKVFKEMK